MTNKNRVKKCDNCGCDFSEARGDSNKQWESRAFCSMKCNNSSKARVTSIFERLNRFQIKGGKSDDECWSWSGAKDGAGYGIISNRKGSGLSPEKAHRVSYEKHFGAISEGLNICHSCDNPECTNPNHLFAGSQKDNMIDCSRKGRLNKKSFKNLIAGKRGYKGAAAQKNKV